MTGKTGKYKILVVDDDARVIRLVRSNLAGEDYKVLTALDGKSALAMIEQSDPDLVVIDWMMPGLSGADVVTQVREWSDVPFIFLTAAGDEASVLRGFSVGADDFVTKPFVMAVLMMRIQAVLRRGRKSAKEATEKTFAWGSVAANWGSRSVTSNGRAIKLSPIEYKLFHLLATNAGKVILHEDILSQVWGREYREEVEYLRVYMRYVRLKLEDDPSNPQMIKTEPGVGYWIPTPPVSAEQKAVAS